MFDAQTLSAAQVILAGNEATKGGVVGQCHPCSAPPRTPVVAATIQHLSANPSTAPRQVQAAQAARRALQDHGWEPSAWQQLVGERPPPSQATAIDGLTQPRWQQHATFSFTTAARAQVYSTLDSQGMLDPQTGPHASRAFATIPYTTIPYTTEVTCPDHIFRILMLRRLRLPWPLTERACRCRRTLDPLGDHRAACSRAGVLRSRGVPREHAAARVCREAGARVTMHARLANLNVPAVQRVEDRTIEVIATGLPLWHGSQLAIDTTLVSPLTGAAQPRRRGGQCSIAHSPAEQRADIPRAGGVKQMPACCPGHGGWRPLEPGSSNFLPAPRSPGNTRTFAAHRGGFSHRAMVSHPYYTRRYASIRSIPAQPVSRQRSQWRWCLPTPRATSHPSTIHLHCPQSTSRAVRGLMGRGFCPFGVCTSGDWPV